MLSLKKNISISKYRESKMDAILKPPERNLGISKYNYLFCIELYKKKNLDVF